MPDSIKRLADIHEDCCYVSASVQLLCCELCELEEFVICLFVVSVCCYIDEVFLFDVGCKSVLYYFFQEFS